MELAWQGGGVYWDIFLLGKEKGRTRIKNWWWRKGRKGRDGAQGESMVEEISTPWLHNHTLRDLITGPEHCHIHSQKIMLPKEEGKNGICLKKKKKKNADALMRRLKILWLAKSGSLGDVASFFPSFLWCLFVCLFCFSEAFEKKGLSVCPWLPSPGRSSTRDFGQAWDSAVLALFTPWLLTKGTMILEHSPEKALLPFLLLFFNAPTLSLSHCVPPGDTKFKKARSLLSRSSQWIRTMIITSRFSGIPSSLSPVSWWN